MDINIEKILGLVWVTNIYKDKFNSLDWKPPVQEHAPRATEFYNQEQLKSMEMIGLYRPKNLE